MIWAYAQSIARRLLAWSVISVAAGAGLIVFGDWFWRAFGIQAVVWGVIDGVIGWFGLRSAERRARPAEVEARNLRRLLWINAGLDVLYLVGGLWLAFGLGSEWRGHGWGISVQGGFLLVFDALHALGLPHEPRLPGLRFFAGAEHQAFHLPATTSDAPAAVLVHGFPGTPAEMRAIGESLHRAGFNVHGLLLPGFGADIATLSTRRYGEWVEAVEVKLRESGSGGAPVLLVGYSFGGALAAEVASRVAPAGLILLAPFMWTEPVWLRVLLTFISPLLPYSFKPYARANFDDPKFQHTLTRFIGGADLTDPALRAALRDFAVPSTLLQEVRRTSRAYRLAAGVRAPVLVVQGETDEVARPTNTERLVAALPAGTTYVKVRAGHDLAEPTSPGWAEVERAVLDFARGLTVK